MRTIITFCLFACFSFSCTDYLNVKPSNVLAIANYEEVKALLGAHLKMYNDPTYTGLKGVTIPYKEKDIWTMFHLYSDDVDTDKYIKTSIGNNNKVLFNESINWKNTSMPGKIWQTLYLNIGFYNTIIDELSRVDASGEEKDIVRCEVLVLRAWHLFKLIQYFSPYELDKYGIPVNLDAQLVGDYDASRKTQTEVYRILVTDLNKVLEAKTSPRATYNVFFDHKIVHALLAEIYLFKGGSGAGEAEDYDQAITHAKVAMEGRALQSIDEYIHFPRFEEKQGVKKDYGQGLFYDNRNDNLLNNIVGSKYSRIAASDVLVDMYDDADVRKTIFFDANKNIIKYDNVNPVGSYMSFTVYTFFSYAEMHLIVAESFARKGEDGEARKWLEDFQRCRIREYAGFKGTDILQEILDERRREFCFEYDMRWCDLARTQKGWTRNSYGDVEVTTCTLEDGDYRFALPIPVSEELQYNDIEQNPGWLLDVEKK